MKNVLLNKTFIVSVVLVIILSFFSISLSTSSKTDVIKCYFGNISNPWFIFALLIIGLINSTKMFNEIRTNYNYLGRFKDRNEAYSNFIKVNTFVNSIIFVVALIFPLIVLLLFRNLPFNNIFYDYYKVKYYIYVIFHLIKILFLLNILINLFLVVSLIIGSKKSLLLFVLVLLDITVLPYNFRVVSSILNMSFRPSYYFTSLPYTSLMLETSISVFYVSLLISLYYMFLSIHIRLKKDIY